MKRMLVIVAVGLSCIGQTTQPIVTQSPASTRPAVKVVPKLVDNAPDEVQDVWIIRTQTILERRKDAVAEMQSVRDDDSKELIRKELGRLNKSFFEPPIITKGIKVGTIGCVVITHINQVVDDSTVMVSISPIAAWRVAQDVAPNPWMKEDVWLTGIDTSKLTDDKDILNVLSIYITGTKQYETVLGGKRTILQAKPFHIEDYLVK